MKTSLIIDSIDTNGNAKSKAISNINPAATNEQLQEFAQRFIALSTNTYSGASVVKKYDVTDDVGGGVASKQNATITIEGDTVTYNGDGTLKVINGSLSDTTLTRDGTGIVYALETDNYSAAVAEFVVPGMIISFTADSDHITIHAGANAAVSNLHVQVSDDSQFTVSKVNGPSWCPLFPGKWIDEQADTFIDGDGIVAAQPEENVTPGDYECILRAITRVNGSRADTKDLTITVTVLEPEE